MGPNQLKQQQQQMLLHFAFVIQITHTEFTKRPGNKKGTNSRMEKKRELIYNIERKQREDIERDVRFENVFISLRLFYLNSSAQHNGSNEIPCENVEKNTHHNTNTHGNSM